MTFRWISILAFIGLLIGASAACGPECPEGQTKCGELCVFLTLDATNCGECGKKCDAGNVCNNGACELSCQNGLTDCNGTCTDTRVNPKNCGACGTECKAGETCKDSKCEISCPSGQSACNDACINTSNDPKNCGSCGNACNAGEICDAGKCGLTCGTDQQACNGACANIKTDRLNCGACDTKCEDGQVCSDGACAATCKADTTDCSGSCVDTKTDTRHCGACGTVCKAGEICKDSKCELVCADTATKCGDACVDTKKSIAHCGACDNACEAGQICTDGKCEVSCPVDLVLCDAACVNTQSDAQNCGGCKQACAAGEVCQSGKCAILCQQGFEQCGTSCIDTQTDTQNCGKCGTTCKVGERCDKGACVPPLCPLGEGQCSAAGSQVCTDTQTDTANCGACGTACQAGETCLKGKCDAACKDCPLWAKGFGASNSQYAYGVATDAQGNVYLAGYFYGDPEFGELKLTSAGSADGFIAKLTPNGNPIWVKQFGNSNYTDARDVAVDSKGNAYVIGRFSGTLSIGTTILNSTKTSSGGDSGDIIVAAIDKDGKWLWGKNYGSPSTDYGYGVAVDSNDNINITGYFYDTMTVGATTLSAVGSADVFVAQLDSTGKETWAKSYGSTSSDYAYRIAVDSSDNIAISGYFYNTMTVGTTTLSSIGSGDIYVIKLDKTGKEVWGASGGGTSVDYGYGIAFDSTGNAYVSGSVYTSSSATNFATFGSTTLKTAGLRDVFVGKIDASTGQWSWAKSFDGVGSTSTDYGRGVAVDSKNNVFVTGYFYSGLKVGKTVLTGPSSSAEVFLAQLDSMGNPVGAIRAGDTSSDLAYGIHVDSKDNIYIAGYGNRFMEFGKVNVLQLSSTNIFLAKYPARSAAFGPLCPSVGFSVCSGTCLDTTADNNNCGSCGNKCATGEICAGSTCRTKPKIYISEFSTGTPEYVQIKNYDTKDIDLNGVWLYINDWTSQFEVQYASDGVHTGLPKFTLKAGASVYAVDSGATTGEIQLSSFSVFSSSSQGHLVMLCLGRCTEGSSDNIIDAVKFGTTNLKLPQGLTFFPGVVSRLVGSDSSKSYIRSTAPTAPVSGGVAATNGWAEGNKTR